MKLFQIISGLNIQIREDRQSMDRLELNLKILEHMHKPSYDPEELVDIFMTVATREVLKEVLDILEEENK